MNKFKSMLAMAVCTLAISSSAIAGDVWSEDVTINHVEVYEDNIIIIYVPIGTANTSDCRGSSLGKMMYVMSGQNTMTDASVKSVLSLILVALTSKIKVDVYHDHLDTCFIRNVRI